MARYEAAQDWFDEKDHLVISNGPFYLERFDPPAQFAELRRLPRPDATPSSRATSTAAQPPSCPSTT